MQLGQSRKDIIQISAALSRHLVLFFIINEKGLLKGKNSRPSSECNNNGAYQDRCVHNIFTPRTSKANITERCFARVVSFSRNANIVS